jgi:alpha-galactosidase
VKVYILAGQSNMVGMGDLAGARPQYGRVFYSADPAIIPGVTVITRNERGGVTDQVVVDRLTVAGGQFEVPVTGTYFIRTGAGDSTNKVTLEAGKRYPIPQTDPRSFRLERVDIPAHGDLVTVTKRDGKFPYLVDDQGKWTARGDVTYTDPRLFPDRASSMLSATSNNGKSIGPELGFGSVIGTFHDGQVLIIKTAMGNRSLQFDFRPPSSGRTDPNSQFEAYEYREMVKGVHDTLSKIDKVMPGYAGQGYEIAGFGWFQGHKDSGSTKEDYEKHLVNLINDLRKEFNAPKMKAVVATVGFHGYRINTGSWKGVWEAQMAVGDPKQHPEFTGNVASVDTRDFWREVAESPTSQDYHYNRNAETYLLVGEAMGRAMVRLEGGEAAEIPKSDREAGTAAAVAAEAARTEPTDEQKAAHQAAIKPLILESSLAAFLANPKNQPAIQAAIQGQKPAKPTPYLNDILDTVVEYYQVAGIRDYDWKPCGGDMRNAPWDYYGFDLPGHPNRIIAGAPAPVAASGDEPEAEEAPKAKGKVKAPPALKITLPAGMENWTAPDFDVKKAGWKTGPAPFGESAEKLVLPEWASGRIARRQPKTVIDNDVLLLRQSFELPPLKDGYRYRIRISGSVHNNMGESYAISVNGKLLFENREGVTAWRRQGGLPRGVAITPEFRELFKGGKVTIAASNFSMENFSADRFIPPGLPLSVWIEEQKIPQQQ